MTIPDNQHDPLMKDYKNTEDLIGETGLLKQLIKHLLERAMHAEMTENLGYEQNASARKKPPIPVTAANPNRVKR